MPEGQGEGRQEPTHRVPALTLALRAVPLPEGEGAPRHRPKNRLIGEDILYIQIIFI